MTSYRAKGKRAPSIRLYEDEVIVDLFAGGGGASTGIELATGLSPILAINHDREALAMHKANHPDTIHLREDVRDVNPRKRPELRGKRIGLAWFSPDCTFHSKARGGKPFRDRKRARRIRGLIGIVLKWATLPRAQRPRIICVENVEEIEFWGPLGTDGTPDKSKKGVSFQRWVTRLKNLGYSVEWRQLTTCNYGDPTKRKRLFIIARCDGRPIAWPVTTHGNGPGLKPFRTPAEHLDFSLPVPSIFMSNADAKKWAKTHGTGNPKRPLAPATLRRIARGIQRFVLDSADPFIIPTTHPRDTRSYSIHEPIKTITAVKRGEFAMVSPVLMQASEQRHVAVHPADEPIRTITASAGRCYQLITPILQRADGTEPEEQDGQLALPIAADMVMAPSLITTGNGERAGQLPRVRSVRQPYGTITATGSQGALVAAFLAKHNAGHEATGQRLTQPVDTLTTRDSKAIVTSHLVKMRGSMEHRTHSHSDVRDPLPTLTAGGTHIAEVRTFLKEANDENTDAQVTVTIKGETYVLVDIGMRMLTPRELFSCQGFPANYEITTGECVHTGAAIRFTKEAQTRLVGNSVPPNTAAAIIAANLTKPVTRRRTA